MDKSYKKPLLLITFGVILFAAFNNLNYVANFLKSCIGLLAPILSGLLLAFVLSVPVRGLAKRLRRKLTKEKALLLLFKKNGLTGSAYCKDTALTQRNCRHILLRSIGNLFCKAFRAK